MADRAYDVSRRFAQYIAQEMGRDRPRTTIHSLPNELLLQILPLTLPELGQDCTRSSFQHTVSKNAPPWSLTRACRRWRDLALYQCPALWATIIIPPSPSSFHTRLAHGQLSRSSNCPISLQLGEIDDWDCVKSLFGASNRWKRVHLAKCPIPHSISAPLCPILESLHCEVGAFRSHFMSSDQGFPRLRSLSIHGHGITLGDQPLPNLLSTCPSLTSLKLSGFEYNTILPLLRDAPISLRSLSLRDIRHGTSSIPEAISLTNVIHLSLHGVQEKVVNVLQFPQLEELVVSEHLPLYPWKSSFHSTITSARLSWSTEEPPGPLVNFIGSCANLVSLDLHVLESDQRVPPVCRTEELLECLSDTSLCPGLTRISIGRLPPHPRTVEQIAAFARLVRLRAPILRYAFYDATSNSSPSQNPDWSLGLGLNSGTEAMGSLKRMLEELLVDYPHLELVIKLRSQRAVTEQRSGLWGWFIPKRRTALGELVPDYDRILYLV